MLINLFGYTICCLIVSPNFFDFKYTKKNVFFIHTILFFE